jgi:hypothetical protein
MPEKLNLSSDAGFLHQVLLRRVLARQQLEPLSQLARNSLRPQAALVLL